MTDARAHLRVSLGIITKNRSHDLIACLASIEKQTTPPDEILIVDSSTDTKRVRYPVCYMYEPKPGFPNARNLVLDHAKNQWVIFTDDDCVTNSHWIERFQQVISARPDAAAIAGESKSWFPDDIISLTTMFNEMHWKSRARRGNRIVGQ